MNDESAKPSQKLIIKGTPYKGIYFGKKAAFGVVTIAFIVLFAVIYGIAFRDPASNNLNQASNSNSNLTAATEVSKKIYEGVPDAIKPYPETGTNNISNQSLPSEDKNSSKLRLMRTREQLRAFTEDSSLANWGDHTVASNIISPLPVLQSSVAQINAAAKQIINENDHAMQTRKEAFLAKANIASDTDYLANIRKPARTQYELKATTIIPATLITGINSDLPGDIFAQVKEDVYDTTTGRYLLIPKGTKLYGMYDSQIAYAQGRLLVTWTRLIYPDGSALNIGGMTGGDKGGYAGFNDIVNNHYGRLISAGLLTSLFSAGFQLSQPQPTANNNQLTSQQIAAASVGQQMAALGIKVTEKNLNIQPTIEIRPGYEFVVKVAKDIVFPAPYHAEPPTV